jgi:hypothetical protein
MQGIEDDSDEPYCITYGRCVPTNVRFVIQEAMRVASDADGAPSRCRRKSCRKSGHCHFEVERNGDGVCKGGIRRETMDKAVLMLFFLAHIGRTAR